MIMAWLNDSCELLIVVASFASMWQVAIALDGSVRYCMFLLCSRSYWKVLL